MSARLHHEIECKSRAIKREIGERTLQVFDKLRLHRIVTCNHVFHPKVKCPYCGAQLTAQAEAWIHDDHGEWIAEEIQMECTAMPDTNSDEWINWYASHTNPADVTPGTWWAISADLMKTINQLYRFDLKQDG